MVKCPAMGECQRSADMSPQTPGICLVPRTGSACRSTIGMLAAVFALLPQCISRRFVFAFGFSRAPLCTIRRRMELRRP